MIVAERARALLDVGLEQEQRLAIALVASAQTRDLLVDEIAQYVDVTVIDQPNGTNNILIGSTPVLLSARSRGVELRRETMGDTIEATIRVSEDGTLLNVNTGAIGGLMRQREETVAPVVDKLERFTSQLIFQVNRVHAAGRSPVRTRRLQSARFAD